MKLLKPKGLVITRKRKKWKFAHFNEWENCFGFNRGDDVKEIRDFLSARFRKKQPLVLEIAAGSAQFSLELARRHPEIAAHRF